LKANEVVRVVAKLKGGGTTIVVILNEARLRTRGYHNFVKDSQLLSLLTAKSSMCFGLQSRFSDSEI